MGPRFERRLTMSTHSTPKSKPSNPGTKPQTAHPGEKPEQKGSKGGK